MKRVSLEHVHAPVPDANHSTVLLKEFNSRQTNALGETLTLAAIIVPVPAYSKPVQILNGVKDFFYCHGDCVTSEGDVTADALELFYPNRDAAKSEAVNIDDVGHNINLHFARHTAFEKTLAYVERAGIKV